MDVGIHSKFEGIQGGKLGYGLQPINRPRGQETSAAPGATRKQIEIRPRKVQRGSPDQNKGKVLYQQGERLAQRSIGTLDHRNQGHNYHLRSNQQATLDALSLLNGYKHTTLSQLDDNIAQLHNQYLRQQGQSMREYSADNCDHGLDQSDLLTSSQPNISMY